MIGEGSPTLGVVGGGQLGRMLSEAAAPLGVDVLVSDPTPDCPAAAVARDQIVGDFDDPETVRRLARRADVLTYEIELADPDLLERISEEEGVPVHPDPESLRTTGDKLTEKRRLEDAGVPVPRFTAVDDEADLADALDTLGSPLMLKARRGGYDGRGNAPVTDVSEARDAFGDLSGFVAEEMVTFERELSVIGIRGDGERATFPTGENVHEAEILRETIVPARTDRATADRAEAVARDVLDLMDGRGVFGIELFETDDDVLVNEIAPRPHNSGHYTIEGAITSQFEQHARAVLGWPLGSTSLRDQTVSANVLGAGDTRPANLLGVERVLSTPGAAMHWYGKRDVRPLRKMGHVTLVPTGGEDREDLLDTVRTLIEHLAFE